MNKKEEVIRVARELFTKYGYKKVSMDEIANTANVTKKTIYSYFSDKEAMFKYFIEEELTNMKDELEKNLNNNESFTERVSKLLYYSLLYRRNSDLIKTVTNETKNENKVQCTAFLKYYDDQIVNYIEEKINEEIELGTIKKCNAHLTAFIIYKVYFAILFEYDREIDEKKVTKEVTNILKDGLFN